MGIIKNNGYTYLPTYYFLDFYKQLD
jgi:hypothetical protein